VSSVWRKTKVTLARCVKPLYCWNRERLRMKKPLLLSLVIIKVFGELLFIYGLLAWVYGISVQSIHPEWLPLGLSHLTPWIRVDTFTIISFIISAVGFFIWRLTRELLSRFSWIRNQTREEKGGDCAGEIATFGRKINFNFVFLFSTLFLFFTG
jgi:hypothetical protein